MTPKKRKNALGYKAERGNLIPFLQDIQEKFGYLPEESIRTAADFFGISENEIFGVATFYAQFRFTKPAENKISICLGTACHVRGGHKIFKSVCGYLRINPGEKTADDKFSIERTACFGSCALAPVVIINDKVYGRMNTVKVIKLLEELS